MAFVFAVALFVSAFLLFWVQPLAGKMLLPLLGGTPAVWNTCMLFFQALLLAGYAYALILTRWLSGLAQAAVHLALLALAALALPVALNAAAAGGVPEGASPEWWLLRTLLVTVGPPFFVLSASAPLLQGWFSRTRAESASDPYYLYAASNAGSLFALLGFPVLLEPALTLGQQSRAWASAYSVLFFLFAACAVLTMRARKPAGKDEVRDAAHASSEPLSLRRRLRWVLLAFVPSSLVLGVTTHVTTDLVAVPLLWIIPLALYLLSFVIVFARGRTIPRGFAARLVPSTAVLVTMVYLSGAARPAWFLILFHLAFLFAAALVCHGQLADDRPAASHLAEFYLCLAVGGVLGGLFNAVVAPLLFNTVAEYPLVILLASYLRPAYRNVGGTLLGLRLGAKKKDESVAVGNVASDEEVEGDVDGKRLDVLDVLLPLSMGLIAAVLMLATHGFEMSAVERAAVTLGLPLFMVNHFFAPRPVRFALGLAAVMLAALLFADSGGRTLHASRNFYGTHRVEADSDDSVHWLHHGSTLHGKQYTDAARACEPTSYYHRKGPLGSVFESMRARKISSVDIGPIRPSAPRSFAVVGLGAGTTAAYALAGESWTFYEIDPAVVRIAREPSYFTYLSACAAAPMNVVVGDARLRMREAPDAAYDLIVLDAFSSDAVPAHLLTREALALYLSKLAPGGVIAFHVSNRSLELERVVGGLVADARLTARIFDDHRHDSQPGLDPSTWVAVARRAEDLGPLVNDPRWLPLDATTHKLALWRDDFSDVLGVFRWR
ncbi:MAG: hypothetical protein QOH49_3312 [Acidobacteriota bacterium]|jgi:hypothetical protein|nr:hypothetical protein [Acidobacteriota bacterium]